MVSGILLGFTAMIIYVFYNVLFRKVDHIVHPFAMNAIRTTIAMVTFWIIGAFAGIFGYIQLLTPKIWVMLIISIVFGQIIGDTAFFLAQQKLGTTMALGVSGTFPFFTILISILFFQEPFSYQILISAVLITFGVILMTKKENSSSKSLNIFAIMVGLIASLSFAIGTVLTDQVMNAINDLTDLDGFSSLLGNIIRFPFASAVLIGTAVGTKNLPIRTWSKKTWLILIAASIIGSSIGAYIYAEAIRLAGATVMSIIITAAPIFSIPVSWGVNREKISAMGIIGILMTLAGVVIIFF